MTVKGGWQNCVLRGINMQTNNQKVTLYSSMF